MKPFNLYHITNAFFVKSIKEVGLGAIDPVKEFGLWDILRQAYLKCEDKIPKHPKVTEFKEITNLMIHQKNGILMNPITGKRQEFNFSHGKLYLSMSLDRALGFAKYNVYGSEILNRIMIYLDVLEAEGIEFRFECDGIDLNGIRKRKPDVCLIQFKSFDGLELEVEDGPDKNELDMVLKDEGELQRRIAYPEFLYRMQLRTTQVIEPHRLKIFKLKFSPDPNEPFEYSLFEW